MRARVRRETPRRRPRQTQERRAKGVQPVGGSSGDPRQPAPSPQPTSSRDGDDAIRAARNPRSTRTVQTRPFTHGSTVSAIRRPGRQNARLATMALLVLVACSEVAARAFLATLSSGLVAVATCWVARTRTASGRTSTSISATSRSGTVQSHSGRPRRRGRCHPTRPIFGERIERYAPEDVAKIQARVQAHVAVRLHGYGRGRWQTERLAPPTEGTSGPVYLVSTRDRPDRFIYEVAIRSDDTYLLAVMNSQQRNRRGTGSARADRLGAKRSVMDRSTRWITVLPNHPRAGRGSLTPQA